MQRRVGERGWISITHRISKKWSHRWGIEEMLVGLEALRTGRSAQLKPHCFQGHPGRTQTCSAVKTVRESLTGCDPLPRVIKCPQYTHRYRAGWDSLTRHELVRTVEVCERAATGFVLFFHDGYCWILQFLLKITINKSFPFLPSACTQWAHWGPRAAQALRFWLHLHSRRSRWCIQTCGKLLTPPSSPRRPVDVGGVSSLIGGLRARLSLAPPALAGQWRHPSSVSQADRGGQAVQGEAPGRPHRCRRAGSLCLAARRPTGPAGWICPKASFCRCVQVPACFGVR